jgi:N-acyl-phosphatidylethanolamine-hydrolysing phospholipase D
LVTRVGARQVVEQSWWEDHSLGTVRLTCVPAQHSSGRGVRDRNRSLWCGWVIVANDAARRSVYFAGDTAYCPAFTEIGARVGPFDVCLLPIGAYEPRWYMQYVHMTPEEAVRAFSDLTNGVARASSFVPIHWGSFRIADDALDEPPHRLRAEWLVKKLAPESLAFLAHGETRRWPIESSAAR